MRNEYNYDLLKMFFISLLWRAAVSQHEYFSKVSLGPYEARALAAIKGNDPGDENFFSVFLSRLYRPDGDLRSATAMLCPFPERHDGILGYRFILGRVVAYVKTDKRPFESPWNLLMLKAGQPLWTLAIEFAASSEFRAFRKVLEAKKSALQR